MSSKEQPPHGTYASKSSRGGVFLHQTTLSPPAISGAPMEPAASSRPSTYPPHNLNRPQDEQIQELLKTLDLYRKEVDRLNFQLEESQNRARAEKSKSDQLERLLQEERSAHTRSREGFRQAQAATTVLSKQSRSFGNPPAPRPTDRLAIMSPPSSQEVVRSSANHASAQHHTDHLSEQLNHFFHQAGIWAKTYANAPVPAALQSITPKFKERHRNLAISSHLLHDAEIGCHVITKLILSSIIDATFQPKCFEHFRPEFKGQLRAEHRKVYGGIASEERKAFAEARAHVIKIFVQDPNWAGFLNTFVSNNCSKLWQLLQPLFGPGAAADNAWPSFVGLFRQAVSIALTMHQQVCLFRVDFPPVGEGSAFNPADMVIIGAVVDEGRFPGATGPQRLKLSVTPVIRQTLLEASGAIGGMPMCKARVILE